MPAECMMTRTEPITFNLFLYFLKQTDSTKALFYCFKKSFLPLPSLLSHMCAHSLPFPCLISLSPTSPFTHTLCLPFQHNGDLVSVLTIAICSPPPLSDMNVANTFTLQPWENKLMTFLHKEQKFWEESTTACMYLVLPTNRADVNGVERFILLLSETEIGSY